jgi:two-component system nitrogen regulation sensor histidine kinase NtrY
VRRRLRSLFPTDLRLRFLLGAFLFLVLLGVSYLGENHLLSHYMSDWDAASEQFCRSALQVAIGRFVAEERDLTLVAERVGSTEVVRDYLSGAGGDRRQVFARAVEASRGEGVGIEIFDREGTLIAWEGQEGLNQDDRIQECLGGRIVIAIERTQTSSRLITAVPARSGDVVVGAVAARKIIESNAPLTNSLLRREGLGERVSNEVGLPVEYRFGVPAEPEHDGRYCSATLRGSDSVVVGTVNVARPIRSAFLESVDERFKVINAILIFLAVVCCTSAVGLQIRRTEGVAKRCVYATGTIWIVRLAFFLLDIPAGLTDAGIFDPSRFASKFGGGLASSIGELTLTVFALACNVTLVGWIVLKARPRQETPQWQGPFPARLVLAAVVSGIVFWMLRGFAASVRSGVVDSSLTYFDSRELFPSPDIAFMMMNGILLGACVVAIAVGGTLLIVRLLRPRGESWNKFLPWIVTLGLFSIAVAAFWLVEENPLMTVLYRSGAGAVFLGLAYGYSRHGREGRIRHVRRHAFVALAAGALLLYPLLDEFVHERDRGRIEALAVEELRPVDGWLKHVVEEGLLGFQTDDYRERLSEGSVGDVASMAFRRWASSLACSQGYDAMFSVTDPTGRLASRFIIGAPIHAMMEADSSLPLSGGQTFRVWDFGTGVNALKVYAGMAPIMASDGTLLGRAQVVIAAAQQALFRGESPAILRGASQGGIETFYRHITLSEYRDGILLTSNNPRVPIAHPLPEAVAEIFADSLRSSTWSTIDIEGAQYETYFVRRSPGQSSIVALSLRVLGLPWHLVSLVKLAGIYLFLLLIIASIGRIIAAQRIAGYHLSFRDRLLIALVITAILPLALMAIYARVYNEQRNQESIRNRLDDETQNVISHITERPEQGVTVAAYPTDPLKAEELASEIGTDFNVYTDRELRVSSRPQLYDAGFLDRRLSGNVYAAIILGGNRFFVQRERVGSVSYSVGYRPVLDAMQNIIGVVSVPTLFRPEESEDLIARRNSLILGTYMVVMLLIILIASFLANRIARPVLQLTEATRRVARGELDVSIPATPAAGEINELLVSFEQMTRDLRASREDLVRYEREMAWREMAKQVAHEIKNPLTPIRLSIQHLLKTYHDKAPKFGDILDDVGRTVNEQIEALSRIASEFSHFARMPRQNLERVDVRGVIEEAVRLFQQETEVRIEGDFDEDLPEIMADREELRRAFINIIRNGIQAMEGAGRMIIRGAEKDQGILIAVTDFGKGVPDEIREKLFEPNFSTKTDGMGLGLAIVKRTVDDLGGKVWIESEPDKGTTVSVWLPEAEGEPE